ncbi:4-hydroxy-tetrahydrodipicolinate synthase [Rickettsia prowazekii]|uniref:4-hydroxy-tetrahydrodipicolinate synthase n=2 Tax=Rickettsia prowazekii TaxID=782 RepID=DAPA_RICPR|nr:4-hydroxy-tetrahydrodipicolinate synthase [Rickettsia prowazekii]O05969.1 RecName: Full=4-hydroxy-tetrahydrodipicolinate synthase; Short=HTPA synthase [Rickettsia prowazekii str. Madrid E]EOB09796.1 Dihydrodipicolinate synthase [Rickettsia prowazekii str. GvF12]ADE29958.1 Dihydrodipicolinate synthase [Rickettsia prowazekii str. Rp22]AFE49242.1 dihydrodipicolinate synthase [Rickettsia prowazekii str. Chernikova]AFE50088.1 dihydrodipicolinate synthase [Rickettsia prowazekii str. Katsinyian]A
MYNIFKGLITALITPFKDNKLDLYALENILNQQIKHKIDAVLIAGSTGEANSLSFEEYKLLLKTSVDIVNNRMPIISGCSSNNTAYAIELAIESKKIGVDCFMASPPSYVKPTQHGIYKHFEALHEACNLPIMLYSAPTRSGVDFSDETILRLSKLPRILALKDCGVDLERPMRIRAIVKGDFNILTGNDEVVLAFHAQGVVGWISVTSNIAPKLCKELLEKWYNNDTQGALEIHQKLLPLYKALFLESNPIPVKYAAYYLGLCENEIRLPLTEASDSAKKQIKKIITSLSIKI